MSVTVLGSGTWGTALTILLANKGTKVVLWSKIAAEIEALEADRKNIKNLPGAVLPAAPAGVRPCRHDAERIGRRRKAVSVAGRADERVDVGCHAIPHRRTGGKGKQARNQNRMLDSFHLFLLDFNLNSSIADLVF